MQQLNTNIKSSYKPRLIFPHHSQTCYNYKLADKIDGCLNKYYSILLINLQESICFHDQEENLKRFYNLEQFPLKIQLLSEYYKYHEQMPKLFAQEVCKIMGKNIQEKRDVQYRLVKQKMINQQLPVSARTTELQNRLLDIELSYEDFENKNATRIKKVNSSSENITKLKRMVSIKNCSVNFCKTPRTKITKQGIFAKDKRDDKNVKNHEKKENHKLAIKIQVTNKHTKPSKSLHSSIGSDANKSKNKQTLNSINSKKTIQTARIGTVNQFRQTSNKSTKSGSVKSLKSIQLKKNPNANSCKILSLKPAQKNLIIKTNENSSKKQNKLKLNEQKETPIKPANSMFTKLIQARKR